MEFRALRVSLRTVLGFGSSFTVSQVGFSGRELAWTERRGSRLRKDIRRELREDEERSLRKRSGASGELSAPSDSSRTVWARHTPTTALPSPSITEDDTKTELRKGNKATLKAFRKCFTQIFRKIQFKKYCSHHFEGVHFILTKNVNNVNEQRTSDEDKNDP